MSDSDLGSHELMQGLDVVPGPTPPTTADNAAEPANVTPRDESGRFASKESEAPEDLEAAADNAEAPAEDGDSDELESEKEEPAKSARRRSARERISQLTAQKNEALARAATAERQAEELLKYLQQAPDPNLEFEDPARFTQESVRRVMAEQRAQDSNQQAQMAREASVQKSREMFQARLEAMRDELPDFDDVFTEEVPISFVAVEFLGESEVGPKIAHHLGKHPSLARRIAALDPVRQGIELARIEAQVKTPPPKRITKAPPPARPLATTGSAGTFDAATASVEELQRHFLSR